MKKSTKLLFLLPFLFPTLTACDLFGGGGNDEKADATLYHLTLTANIDINQDELKATYGYGEPSTTVVEGVRDPDEIEELKKAGATDEDIAKAGVRQSDGSYYFFDQDPIYIETPHVDGYKLLGFFYKDTEQLAYNPIITDIDGQQALTRWNMDNKDVVLEARYQKLTYKVTYIYSLPFIGEIKDVTSTNPTTYSYVDDGAYTLIDPITSNEEALGFDYWEYNSLGNGFIKTTTLPVDWEEDELVLFGVFKQRSYEVVLDYDESLLDVKVFEIEVWEHPEAYQTICKTSDKHYKVYNYLSGNSVAHTFISLDITVKDLDTYQNVVGAEVNGEFDGYHYLDYIDQNNKPIGLYSVSVNKNMTIHLEPATR